MAVQNKRIEVTYIHDIDEKSKQDVLITTFRRSDVFYGIYPSKYNYSDLPEHWKYLENSVPLHQSPFPVFAELIVVEKYSDIAIGFNYFFSKRPVVIFRECWKNFKSLSLGDVVQVSVRKMYIHVDKPTLILTDLHATQRICNYYLFHDYESAIENDLVKIINFTIQIKTVQKINKHRVLFTDFGAIIIPRKLYKILSMGALFNAVIVGAVKYSIIFISENQVACWRLRSDFSIYKDNILYARSTDGIFELIKKENKKKRMLILTGPKIVRMVEPIAEKTTYSLQYTPCWTFMKLKSGFIKFVPEKKRTIIRNF